MCRKSRLSNIKTKISKIERANSIPLLIVVVSFASYPALRNFGTESRSAKIGSRYNTTSTFAATGKGIAGVHKYRNRSLRLGETNVRGRAHCCGREIASNILLSACAPKNGRENAIHIDTARDLCKSRWPDPVSVPRTQHARVRAARVGAMSHGPRYGMRGASRSRNGFPMYRAT